MKKKVNLNRPEISSEEIAKSKNFDSVLKNQKAINNPLYKKPFFLAGIIIATIAAITSIILLTKESTNKSSKLALKDSGANADSVALANFYKKKMAKPCINPPLDGVNVPYTTYKIMAEKSAILDFKTGSKIEIPKNVFVDENGKSLKGEVELRYREFHDPVDFFVSGIPMTFDSAGVRYQFKSAGMMEMLAYQNGKPVKMASGKSINIELASNYKGTEYNLYKLDTVKNNWACLGKDEVISETTGAKSNSKNEKVSFEETSQYKSIETKTEEMKKQKEVKIAALPKLIPEPQNPKQVKNDKYTFNLDVDAKEYPELALYKGVLFEVGDENKNFDKSMYDITWDEATIKGGTKKGENYSLILKKASKKYNLIVYPVFEGKNYETALKIYQDKFAKYTVTLEKRIIDEKQIEAEYQTHLLELKKQQEAMERKWKEEENDQFKKMSTDEKVKRMFAISSFGVFNSDNPALFPKGVSCSANLTNEKNVKLMCYDIYLVDRAENALFSYNRNPIAKFSFNPQSTNMLWTVDNGVLYWLKPEQFMDIKSSDGMSTFKMNRVDQKFKNTDEIKAYFNF